MRCMHESQMHEQSSFLTFTYADDHVPEHGSLDVKDWQLFAKRLRRQAGPFRFLHCGEYGDKFERPHLHACIFGLDFAEDREPLKKALFVSPFLNGVWGKGHVAIGNLTFETAAYVARYVTKKITGDKAKTHYATIDEETGEEIMLKPEYATMSRRPGIGYQWYQKFKDEVYPSDTVVVRGHFCKPPRFYDLILEKEDPEMWELVRTKRTVAAMKYNDEEGPEWRRLLAKEKILESKMKNLTGR